MFAVHGDCDHLVVPTGLRGPDDLDAVLICRQHLPHLRQLRPIEAERLASYLRVQFVSHNLPHSRAVAQAETPQPSW